LEVGCPITFDHLHHRFCTGDLTAEEAAHLAASTWGDITPMQHYSSSKSLYEDSTAINRSHADYVYEVIPDFGFEVDIEVESKAKDLSILKYRKDLVSSNNLLLSPEPFEFEKNSLN
jgi:UV DNA damage endonuclease